MNQDIFQLSIGELGDTGTHFQRRIMPSQHLHYCPASAGTWGIVRVGLLVPESVMLQAAPSACGRHGAIAAVQIGYKKRLFMLHVDEMDIVSGQHLDKVPDAVAEILSKTSPRPKAMMICATCIDDLLGSDYEGLAAQLEAQHGIPFRACHMVPTAQDGKAPPIFSVQQAVYDFLEKPVQKNRAVNIIGSVAPIESESEFYKVMADAGFDKVMHVAACNTFGEFRKMSESTHNIIIKPVGRLAAQQMERKLGIPYCFAPGAYGIDAIDRTYSALEKFLGASFRTREFREEAMDAVREYRKTLGPLTVAVGSTANGSPFELTRALIGYGFKVPYIFADVILDADVEHINWLKQHAGDLKVFTNIHPTMAEFVRQKLAVDVALGFDAGYFCPGAKTAPLIMDNQPFGYSSAAFLFREILRALENPMSHREQLFAAATVI
jgi:nitrogenase molybdenum-cofactor synthesis protein NifE